MSEKEYDVVVFGATGFTGQYVADELARVAEEEHVKWAVAGRNVDKLKKVLDGVATRTGAEMSIISCLSFANTYHQ